MATSIRNAYGAPSPWCDSAGKRRMDVTVALVALFLFSPILLLIVVLVRIASGRPVIFRQWRVGRGGQPFELFKFRTMSAGQGGPGLTRNGDRRVTRIGRYLRAWKVDELPQLVNVLRGEMSLVGPRPDLQQFWDQATPETRRVLALKPGITGAASLTFPDEELLLGELEPHQLASFYREHLQPVKAKLDMEYAVTSTFVSDCGLLLQTAAAAVGLRMHANRRWAGVRARFVADMYLQSVISSNAAFSESHAAEDKEENQNVLR